MALEHLVVHVHCSGPQPGLGLVTTKSPSHRHLQSAEAVLRSRFDDHGYYDEAEVVPYPKQVHRSSSHDRHYGFPGLRHFRCVAKSYKSYIIYPLYIQHTVNIIHHGTKHFTSGIDTIKS